MQKRRILAAFLASTAACGVFSATASIAVAQSPAAADALALKPIQAGVDYEQPGRDEIADCKVEPLTENGWTGWVVLGPDGRKLRRFADTNKDGDTDLWCYFQSGIEVYRDVDSDFDKRADRYRWMGTAGTRIGLDKDEDGKLDQWLTISAQEATAELVAAIAAGDEARFERLLIGEDELKKLGLGAELTEKIATMRRQALRDFPRFVQDQKAIGKGSRWIHFAANMPGTVPAGSAGSEKDVTVYENAVAMYESSQSTGQLMVGTMVSVGDTWRLVDLPQIAGSDQSLADSSGMFFSGQALAANDPGGAGISADLQKLVGDLEKIDAALQRATGPAAAKLHDQRADAMEAIASASDVEQRDAWVRQLVDTIGAAVESDAYPDGIARLQKISQRLARSNPELQSYVDFQVINSEYALRVGEASTQKDFTEIQDWRLKTLEKFVDQHPGTIEEARAMLRIGLAKELEDETEAAVKWYTKVATNFAQSDEGKKAAGAVRRLESKGRELPLKGRTIDGKAFDISQLRGKPVVIQYWATWCEPCKQDMKLLADLQARYAKAGGIHVVGINVDGLRNDAVKFVNESKLPWVTLYEEGGLDSSPLANILGVQTLPTILLLDQRGKVVENNIPATQLNEAIDQLVRAKR